MKKTQKTVAPKTRWSTPPPPPSAAVKVFRPQPIKVPSLNTEFAMPRELSAKQVKCKKRPGRACHVELLLSGHEAALRFCTGQKGRLVPVKTPAEATALSRKYCSCVKRGGSPAKCFVGG